MMTVDSALLFLGHPVYILLWSSNYTGA